MVAPEFANKNYGAVMKPFKEELINRNLEFPVDIFIRDNSKEKVTADPHWHDCYEILYILQGSAEQQINNRNFKALKTDQEFKRKKGYILLPP